MTKILVAADFLHFVEKVESESRYTNEWLKAKETHKEISNILNSIFEKNDTSLKLGTGILLPIPKQKKMQGPVKNLQSPYKISDLTKTRRCI